MFRSKLVLASITAVFLACSQVQAAHYTSSWDYPGGGEWQDVGKWSNSPPDNSLFPDNVYWHPHTFDVVIDSIAAGASGEVDIGLTDNRTINKLDCSGQVDLESWEGWVQLTLDHEDGLTNHGYLEIEWIEIIGNVTNLGGAELELCDMDIEGNLLNQAGAVIYVDYEVWVDKLEGADGNLQNDGTIEIGPMSEFGVEGSFDNSGTILIYGGVCAADEQVLDNDGLISGFGILYGEQGVQNYGQIIASGGSLVVACEGTLINTSTGLLRNEPLSSLHIKPWLHAEPADVNNYNYGLIEVNAGGGVTFDCDLVNESGGIIKLRGGTLAARNITQSAGATFEGGGTITTNELLIESSAEIELTGPMIIVGDVNIVSGGTLMIRASQTFIGGHTTNDGTIVLAGGTVIFRGGYSGSGEVIDGAPATGVIIDNGDAGTSSDGTWPFSGAPGFYGENSRYNWVGAGASYSFKAWVLGSREVSLWWNEYPNRSTNVSVEIYNGPTLLDDSITVNQQVNGGKWNALGYYTFTDEAEVRIVSPGSGVTIADAVKFGPANEIVIDNDDDGTSSNGTWNVSGAPGFYDENSRYCWESNASYSFEVQILGTYQISLWWNAYPNRSTDVSVEIYDDVTLLDTVTNVNQQINGGKWNGLGSYSFSDKAKVKIISDGSGVVIADAVKLAPL